jgi:hypothetical protein
VKKVITLSVSFIAIIAIVAAAILAWWWFTLRALSPLDVLPSGTLAYLHKPSGELLTLVDQHIPRVAVKEQGELLGMAIVQDGTVLRVVEFKASDPVVNKNEGDYGLFSVDQEDMAYINNNGATLKQLLQPWYNAPTDNRSWAYLSPDILQQSLATLQTINTMLPGYKQHGIVLQIQADGYSLASKNMGAASNPPQQVFPLHPRAISYAYTHSLKNWLNTFPDFSEQNLSSAIHSWTKKMFGSDISARYDVLPSLMNDAALQFVLQEDGNTVPIIITSSHQKDVTDRMHNAVYASLPKGEIVERELEQFTARYLQGSVDDVRQEIKNMHGYTVQITVNPQTNMGLCTAYRTGQMVVSTNADVCLQYIEQLKARPLFSKRGVSSQGVIIGHSTMLPNVLQQFSEELISIQPDNKPLRWTVGSNGTQQVVTFITDTSIINPKTVASGSTLSGTVIEDITAEQ